MNGINRHHRDIHANVCIPFVDSPLGSAKGPKMSFNEVYDGTRPYLNTDVLPGDEMALGYLDFIFSVPIGGTFKLVSFEGSSPRPKGQLQVKVSEDRVPVYDPPMYVTHFRSVYAQDDDVSWVIFDELVWVAKQDPLEIFGSDPYDLSITDTLTRLSVDAEHIYDEDDEEDDEDDDDEWMLTASHE